MWTASKQLQLWQRARHLVGLLAYISVCFGSAVSFTHKLFKSYQKRLHPKSHPHFHPKPDIFLRLAKGKQSNRHKIVRKGNPVVLKATGKIVCPGQCRNLVKVEERQRLAAAHTGASGARRPSPFPRDLPDEPQTLSLISTKEISLGRRWVDKRPQRAFCRRERKSGR